MPAVPEALQIAIRNYQAGQTVTIAEAYQIAIHYHQTGQVQQAVPLYRKILQADSTNAQVYYLLGAACQALGRLDEAAVHLEQSIRLRPGFAEAHNHLGVARVLQGKLAAAAACFEETLRLKPDYAEARENLAKVVQEQERSRAATAGSFGGSSWSAEEWNHAGIASAKQRNWEEAIRHYREALLLKPDYAEAHASLGKALVRQGRYDEAIVSLRQTVQLQPDMAEGHYELGNALRHKGLVEEAAGSYQQAVRLRPRDPLAHLNLGGVCMELGQVEAAVAADREAVRLRPGYAEAHSNLGLALVAAGRVDEALQNYTEAIRLKPDYPEAHKNRALAWLLQGDFERGWPEYEYRWRCADLAPFPFPQPRWDGSPLQGRTILLWAEQGIGDAIQLIRYVRLVRKGGGRVLVMCPRSLHRLLRRDPAIDHLLERGEEPPPFDVHAPLLSLPALLKTTLTTIPAEVPYLETDDDLAASWRRELGALDGFKIGIAWQGSVQHKDDRFRSVPLRAFGPLAATRGIRLISLQKGPGTEQLRQLPEDWRIVDAGSRLEDWADTAAVLKNLDLVVTVDTAVAHLAGALGMPVWVALRFAPDWRWLLGREDSPWYPSMRLFRQAERDNWTDVFARIAAAAAPHVDQARQEMARRDPAT